MPVIYMDIGFLVGILASATGIGFLGGWWWVRRRRPNLPADVFPSETQRLIQLMSRADHTLEGYITAVQGHLLTLGEELPQDRQRWTVSRDAIANAAEKMKRHVRRLRLIRMGLDDTNVRSAPMNLVHLIENIMVGLEPAATARQVSLRMEVSGGPLTVPADPEMVEEVFTTLLDNAIRHNPAGTEVVADLARNDGTVLVRVSDDGKGIAPDLVSHIFDQGVRERGPAATGNTGMGLYIARLLVELQEGGIHAESEVGKGTVFSVSLPLARSGA